MPEDSPSMTSPSLADFQREIAARMDRGDWPAAAAAAAACRQAWPAERAGWLAGSFVALLADQKEAALQLVEERLATEPTDLECLLQQAECLFALGRRADALAAAEAAAASAGTIPAALDAIGEFLAHAHEHQRALGIYDQAIAAAPDNLSLLTKRALLHRFLGAFDFAARDYDKVLAVSPAHPDALRGRTALDRQSTDGNAIAAMEAALSAGPVSPEDAATLHFTLAKTYEDLGDHAASWHHLGAANGLERARIQYDARLDRAVIERIIEAFPDVEDRTPDTTGESPIFIVGLPRTGTTLVDRILGSHSQLHSAGELAALSEAIGTTVGQKIPLNTLDWVGFASALGGLDGESIAREYLARSRARRGERPRFSDKQVANFFHCALIFRAFPNARIVHLTRHPVAACYAIYKTRFPDTLFPFAYHLTELADFYVGYRQLMAHWHRILPGRILDVAYEDIVTAQEETTRQLLDYVGLPFEYACLEFHRNPASTTTNSLQVRQPLYDSSLDQWRNYAAQLAPLRERLEAAGIAVE
jgi:tetratricopeptide (TPR) repeat protein